MTMNHCHSFQRTKLFQDEINRDERLKKLKIEKDGIQDVPKILENFWNSKDDDNEELDDLIFFETSDYKNTKNEISVKKTNYPDQNEHFNMLLI